MFTSRMSQAKGSARKQIDILDISDGVLQLRKHAYRKVLKVSPVNFELRSEDEQDAITDRYESFLNSIGFPLQILVRTREVDMDEYLKNVADRTVAEKEKVYKQQLRNYDRFVRKLVKTNKILTRHFYVIVPYNGQRRTDQQLIDEQLNDRVDITVKGLAKIGIQSKILNNLEVLDLFYSFYSPEQAKIQPLTQRALELLHSSYIKAGAIDGKS
jgi:hypothetical protein